MKRKRIRKRLKKCAKCKHLRFRKSLIWKQCSKCNCLVEFKARYSKSECPKGKW